MSVSEPALQKAVQEYLALRRSFGYVLAGQDGPLADFADYLDRHGLDAVTVQAAVAWAVEPAAATPLRHFQRLSMVRGFASYLQTIDARGEVPPRDLLPEGRRRVPPHIYSGDEIATLMRQSRLLRPCLRAVTIETVIGLLTVTGVRSGEVVRLDRFPGRHRSRRWPIEDRRHEVQEVEGVGFASLHGGSPRRLPPGP